MSKTNTYLYIDVIDKIIDLKNHLQKTVYAECDLQLLYIQMCNPISKNTCGKNYISAIFLSISIKLNWIFCF